MNLNNRTLGAFAKKKQPLDKKPTSLAKIISDLCRLAKGNEFVQTRSGFHFTINGEKPYKKKAFNYTKFGNYCNKTLCENSQTNSLIQLQKNYANSEMIRDIVMEQIDPKFNRNNPTKFRGMDCIK